MLQGPAAAVGIALVNTFGACGGIGPVLVGHMKVSQHPRLRAATLHGLSHLTLS